METPAALTALSRGPLLAALLVVAVFVGVLNFALFAPHASQTGPVSESVISYHSSVHVVATHPNGVVFLDHRGHNLFVGQGKNITRDLLGALSGAAVTYIGVGNQSAAQAATDVDLGGIYTICGLSKAAGTEAITAGTEGNWTIQKNFTSTCNNMNVNETGLFNQSAAGGLFAETTFTNASLQTNDQISITWYIWVS